MKNHKETLSEFLDEHTPIHERRMREDEEYAREYARLRPRYDAIREIIQLRGRRGITQKELAERVGTYQSQVSRFESGDQDVRLGTLAALADALDAELRLSIVPREAAASYDFIERFAEVVRTWGEFNAVQQNVHKLYRSSFAILHNFAEQAPSSHEVSHMKVKEGTTKKMKELPGSLWRSPGEEKVA